MAKKTRPTKEAPTVLGIMALLDLGHSRSEIAKRFGVCKQRISQVLPRSKEIEIRAARVRRSKAA